MSLSGVQAVTKLVQVVVIASWVLVPAAALVVLAYWIF